MKAILHMIEHDFRNFFRYKWWLAGLISMNLADLLIMAVVYNKMVHPDIIQQIKSYFNFFIDSRMFIEFITGNLNPCFLNG